MQKMKINKNVDTIDIESYNFKKVNNDKTKIYEKQIGY